MMVEFKSPFKTTDNRVYNSWCLYTNRLDTYGCGCQHNCTYCYARSLLEFRGLWDNKNPRVSNIKTIEKVIKSLKPHDVVKLGGMTDCFQPLELRHRITFKTIELLNKYQINYIIVTKNSNVTNDEYLKIYDNSLAHFQITITSTNDSNILGEMTSRYIERVNSISILYNSGYDVSIRLSPLIDEILDYDKINTINCDKILIEFLKVNTHIRKKLDIDYSKYTYNYGGYKHLQLYDKINIINKIKSFKYLTVGEYVKEHHNFFSKNINSNIHDCCNITYKKQPQWISSIG